jgi:hypothetical protein
MERSMALMIWDKRPELKTSFDTVLQTLNELYPDNADGHSEMVKGMIDDVNMRVGSYYPECLIGKRLQIFDPQSSTGTKSPQDICTVQSITTEHNDVYRGSYLLWVYVTTKDSFNYTACFKWDICKDLITELD